MEIKVYCHNCQVEILRTDTDTLKTPLIGSMFRVKKDMEWSLFSPSDTGFDLICPMCEWTFHDKGKVKVAVGDDFVFGVPEVIIPGIVAYVTPQREVIVSPVEPEPIAEEVVAPSCPASEAIQTQVPSGIQDIVEGTPHKEPEKSEQPQINRGDWSEAVDTDEDGETNGEAPPGTVATEPQAPKRKTGRPKGSKNKGAKYRKKRK